MHNIHRLKVVQTLTIVLEINRYTLTPTSLGAEFICSTISFFIQHHIIIIQHHCNVYDILRFKNKYVYILLCVQCTGWLQLLLPNPVVNYRWNKKLKGSMSNIMDKWIIISISARVHVLQRFVVLYFYPVSISILFRIRD